MLARSAGRSENMQNGDDADGNGRPPSVTVWTSEYFERTLGLPNISTFEMRALDVSLVHSES